MVFIQSRETERTMVKWTNAGGQTKRANERSFVYRSPAWRRWRNVKTTYFWQSRLCAICRFQINSEFTAKFFISAAELKALFHGGHFVILRCAKLEKHLKFIPERKCEYQLANEAIYTCAKDVSCFTYNNQTNKRHINFIYKLNLR